MKTYVCTRMKQQSFLESRGFRYYKKVKDIKDPSRWVWLYDDSEEIRRAVDDYYALVK